MTEPAASAFAVEAPEIEPLPGIEPIAQLIVQRTDGVLWAWITLGADPEGKWLEVPAEMEAQLPMVLGMLQAM